MPLKESVAKFLLRFGVSADFLTFLGLGVSFYAAWLVLRGHLFAAGGALLFSGLCDLLDGAVARASGKAGAFGGILDSTLDRYGDGAVLSACVTYFMQAGQTAFAWFSVSALLGSFAISYVRARAECETDTCRVGFWERGERLVLLALAFLLKNPAAAVCVLAFGTHWTVFQRLAFARIQTAQTGRADLPVFLRTSSRSSPVYFFKAAVLVALLFLTA